MSAERKRPAARTQLLLVALTFLVPLGLAFWLYYGGHALAPEGRTNHGELLQPIVNLRDALPESRTAALADDRWLLVHVNGGACEADCRDALYRLRQSHRMLGRDMQRVQRVFLHGPEAPDRVFLEHEHPGLLAFEDAEAAALITGKRPQDRAPGGLYLIDPLGNLVMYFPPDVAPGDMVDDIKHLLKISQIG